MISKSYEELLKKLYQNSVGLIRPLDAKTLLNKNKALVLDVRTKKEYEVSHLEKSKFYEFSTFQPAMVKASPDIPIIVYCTIGYRSERAGKKLMEYGFKEVYNLYGGIFQWINEGLPIINSFGQATDKVHTYNEKWEQWLTGGIGVY